MSATTHALGITEILAQYREAILRQQYPHIPWQKIAAFRHVLIHDYDEIDLGRVWDIIEYALPVLKPDIEALLRQLDESTGAS